MLDTVSTEMLLKLQKDHVDRHGKLVKVLGMSLDWRINNCTDGQHKKVQLVFRLLKPFG
jgi:ABC-type uncharacterized transport system ATPase subunit